MQTLKFAIIGAITTENTLDLKKVIESLGHACYLLDLKKTVFDISASDIKIYNEGVNLGDLDIFIFRGYNINFLEAQILSQRLMNAGKVVVDECLGKGGLRGKVFESIKLNQANLKIPHTYQSLDFSGWMEVLPRIAFPALVKPLLGQKGQGIQKLASLQEARSFFQQNPHGFLLQEYLPSDGDLRILVVGGQVLGGIKRFVVPGDFRSNVSLGGRTEPIPLNDHLKMIALTATRAMNYEIAGVDILEHDSQYYVLEVNYTPQWQGFKQVTGINPAEHIIKYCLEKYEKKDSGFF